jgi:hypothetical protein
VCIFGKKNPAEVHNCGNIFYGAYSSGLIEPPRIWVHRTLDERLPDSLLISSTTHLTHELRVVVLQARNLVFPDLRPATHPIPGPANATAEAVKVGAL